MEICGSIEIYILPWVICKAPGLIFLVFSWGISAIIVTANQFNVTQIVRKEKVPRLASVTGLSHTDGPSESEQFQFKAPGAEHQLYVLSTIAEIG